MMAGAPAPAPRNDAVDAVVGESCASFSLPCSQSLFNSRSDNDGGVCYLSDSRPLLAWFFFRFGAGILHSMANATQLVHGTPRLAASQRT